MPELKGKLNAVQGLSASMSATQGFSASMSNNINLKIQSKFVTATDEPQVIQPDDGFVALSQVVVDAIPSNYGKITWNGGYLIVS